MISLRAGFLFILGIYGGVVGRTLRHHNGEVHETKTILSSNFIGEATNELATAMLQESLDEGDNYVFSPIGYSTILAILAEGARGDTRSQLATSLHFPEDLSAVRQTYKDLLHRMKEKGENKPEFKNWFYSYKNYSIQDQYKEILLDNYLTEVKAVELDYYDHIADDDLLSIDKKKDAIKEVIGEKAPEKEGTPDDKLNKIVDTEKPIKDQVVKVDQVQNDNSVKDEKPPTTEESKAEDKEEKPASCDKNSVPVKSEVKPTEAIKPDETTSMKTEVSTHPLKEEQTESNQKESAPMKKDEVKPKERSLNLSKKIKGKRYFLNKDTVTALTANRLSSSKKTDDGEQSTKRIIIFNGFYYKGNWSVQFHAKNEESPEGKTFFYTSESEKKPAKMMTTVGEFEIGQIPELDSVALEIPYQGDKYSLLLLLPNSRNGLRKLASDLGKFSLPKIDQYLKKKEVQVCLPKVNFYTISKPKAALLKGGVKNLFNKDADLSGINSDGGLYLDELVQLVTMNFEETSTATNFLTSTLGVTRSNTGPELFNANHPFFFFLRERQDGIILAAGKLQDPTKTSHQH